MDKSQRGAIFRSLLERQGPQNLGGRQWPSPVASALEGKRFVLTGILETITRDQLKKLLQDSGARVLTTYSKRLDYLVVGRDSGPSKVRKAQEDGVETLDEEECYNYLCQKLGHPRS